MNYIATFYSHFGAMRFKKDLEAIGLSAVLMPVPRYLSSSCGTCASFSADALPSVSHTDEIEQIVAMHEDDSFDIVFTDSYASDR